MNLVCHRHALRAVLCFAAVLAALLPASTGWCNDDKMTLELVVAGTSTSYSNSAAWGWWNVDKYDTWEPVDNGDFDLVEGRFLVPFKVYSLFLAAERYPTLDALAGQTGNEGGASAAYRLTTEIDVYDLALAQRLSFSGYWGGRVWLGVTSMGISEVRAPVDESGLPTGQAADTAKSRLYGASIGYDGGAEVGTSLTVTGRVVVRWAQGKRNATFFPDGTGGEDPSVTQVQSSDSTDRVMWGGELGLNWEVREGIHIEGGWRYRDWKMDDGPASFNGPFLRVAFNFYD